MKEQLLHFIWQNKLFNIHELKTSDGLPVTILDFGRLNKDAGPDFSNAKIKIGEILFVGNIEIHVHASDWKKHQHSTDRKYDNVILHVVFFNDWDMSEIPTLELNGKIPRTLLNKFELLMHSNLALPCKHLEATIQSITLDKWKERLLIERLERKSEDIINHLQTNNNDWEQTCYQLIGKYFGSHINKDPFEMLTKTIDYKILVKNQNDIQQIEAILFGVAGFLNKDFVDNYPRDLKKEFEFLKQKYALTCLQEHQWNFLRIRPISFPTIRLSWFAQLMQQMPLFQKMIDTKNPISIFENIEVSDYWNQHYIFDKWSKNKTKNLGDSFKAILVINVVVPLLFAYGKYTNDENYIENAIDLLYHTKEEQNALLQKFDASIWSRKSAFDTQALLELDTNYCSKLRCLDCAVGCSILSFNNPAVFENIA